MSHPFIVKISLDKAEVRIAGLEAENLALVKMLKRYEWQFFEGGVGYPNDEETCAICEAKRSEGHTEDCAYNKLMKSPTARAGK